MNLVEYRGMFFNEGTEQPIMEQLLAYMNMNPRPRIRIFYGSTETGVDYCESDSVIGYIGRSFGAKKIPLLIKATNSSGGEMIKTSNIIRITIDKKDVYKHPKYNCNVDYKQDENGNYVLYKDTEDLSDREAFMVVKTEESANKAKEFFTGIRNSLIGIEYADKE